MPRAIPSLRFTLLERHEMTRCTAVLTIVALLHASCGRDSTPNGGDQTNSEDPTPNGGDQTNSEGATGDDRSEQKADATPAGADFTVPPPKPVKRRLEARGYAATKQRRFKRLAKLYRHLEEEDVPAFVTTDAVVHTSHLYFNWVLRFLEIAYLRQDLRALVDRLIVRVMEAREKAEDRRVRQAAMLGMSYLSVGKRLLGGSDVDGPATPWEKKIQREVERIRAAEGIARSPLFGYKEDYSQYKPRGHYTRSEAFRNYFRAMMWFGRMTFRLNTKPPERGRQQTRAAVLLCRALSKAKVEGRKAIDVWRRLYETTAFFAGRADDILPTDYNELLDEKLDLDRGEALDRFMAEARKLRKPKILGTWHNVADSAGRERRTQGMRLFGRRYSLDGEIMQRLVFNAVGPYQGDPRKPPFTCVEAPGVGLVRGFPRGLDVMAAGGWDEAERLLHRSRDDRYKKYEANLERLKKELLDGSGEWSPDHSRPLGWPGKRLRNIAHLRSVPEEAPAFMRDAGWVRKRLTTALGAWTEMKHDTTLYTKQSYTARQAIPLAAVGKGGGADEESGPVRGYVEPEPELYRAVAATVKDLLDRLRTLEFPRDRALVGFLKEFRDDLGKLATISEKELSGRAISEEEYELIEHIGEAFRIPEHGLPHHRDVEKRFRTQMDAVMPIVADVHTDPNSKKVLEEAVGYPMTLFAVCPVAGEEKICVGGAYTYYEFKQPMADRLTDKAWRKRLEGDNAPPMPRWVRSYVVPRE